MTRTPDRKFQEALRARILEEIDHKEVVRSSLRTGASTTRTSRDWARLVTAGIVVTATVAAAWVSIAVVQQRRADAPAASSSAIASPRVSAKATQPEVLIASIHKVVGVGRLSGPITANFRIDYKDTALTLHLTDVSLGRSAARTFQFASDMASATCNGDEVGLLYGSITSARTQNIELRDPATAGMSDLSYMHALAIWPGTTRDSCQSSKVSAGAITWTLPASLRSLAETDHGPTSGAQGNVQLADGRPRQYTVASGDTLPKVLARFNITFEELLYLNPFRTRGFNTTLFVGEKLNLDALARR